MIPLIPALPAGCIDLELIRIGRTQARDHPTVEAMKRAIPLIVCERDRRATAQMEGERMPSGIVNVHAL
jgi:hypothetical protein